MNTKTPRYWAANHEHADGRVTVISTARFPGDSIRIARELFEQTSPKDSLISTPTLVTDSELRQWSDANRARELELNDARNARAERRAGA